MSTNLQYLVFNIKKSMKIVTKNSDKKYINFFSFFQYSIQSNHKSRTLRRNSNINIPNSVLYSLFHHFFPLLMFPNSRFDIFIRRKNRENVFVSLVCIIVDSVSYLYFTKHVWNKNRLVREILRWKIVWRCG